MGCSSSSRNAKYYNNWLVRAPHASITGLELNDPVLFDLNDFEIDYYIGEGGMGKVYAATNLHTRRKFALKFFGYTSRKPIDADIQREIDFMVKLSGVKGVVQIEGIFMDDPIQHPAVGDVKEWKIRYPVIVMEVMNGGALYDRVQRHKFMSEQILKQVFRGFVEGLMGIHKLNLLHRDLKLDNIMLQSLDDENQAVKIIDFGMMVFLPPGEKKYTALKISGTRGYLAPESIEHKEYSVYSDIWQVGVVLYNMLSGAAPFHAENLEQTVKGKYYPMVGPEWDKISDNAKDLVKRLLVVKPDWRLSLAQVLKHKWMTTKAPNVDLGVDYARRIKALALRTKMKNFFQWNEEMMQQSRIKQEHLREMLPFLKNKTPVLQSIAEGENRIVEPVMGVGVEGGEFGSPVKIVRRSTISNETIQVATDLSMRTFKLRLHNVRDLSNPTPSLTSGSGSEGGTGSVAIGEEGVELSTVAESEAVEINYERFVDILNRARLPVLATPKVFSLFDIGNTGFINLRDFLLTMLAYQPFEGTAPPVPPAVLHSDNPAIDAAATVENSLEEAAKMFFRMFDINNTGYVNHDEFMLALRHLTDLRPPMLEPQTGGAHAMAPVGRNRDRTYSDDYLSHLEELFNEIDDDKDGLIAFSEFKKFYITIVQMSSSTMHTVDVVDKM